MYGKLTPKKTIILIAIILLLISYIGIDYHYKTRSKDILLSTIHASEDLIKVNNFLEFSSNLHSAMLNQPIIKSTSLFDGDYRRLFHYGEDYRMERLDINFSEDKVLILNEGILKYALVYNFPTKSNFILVCSFYDDNRYIILLSLFSAIFLSFGVIFLVCTRFDIDNLNASAAKQAIGMISLGFHEMKQYVAFTNELFKYIQSGKKDSLKERIFIKDYKHLNIGVESMMSIINIKNYDKLPSKNEVTKKPSAINLDDIVDSCVASYKKKGIKFEYIKNHKCLLLIRKDILYAIVGNLIKNAFFFSNRLVWVTTEETEKFAAISIANTGKKIPKNKRKEILKPGIALNGQSGLGLHICTLWCEKINAEIFLESTSVATEFKIVLPKKLILKESNVVSTSQNAKKCSERKFFNHDNMTTVNLGVIDDIETFRIGLKSELTELGFNVSTFEDIDMFLDSIQEGNVSFDCVIVDRHGKGFDAAKDRFPESCRYYNFKGKIILYSSNVEDHQLEYYKSLGFDSTVSKSVSVDWNNVIRSILK